MCLTADRYDLTELEDSRCGQVSHQQNQYLLVGNAGTGTPSCVQNHMNSDWPTAYDLLVLAAKLSEMRSSASLSKRATANPVTGW